MSLENDPGNVGIKSSLAIWTSCQEAISPTLPCWNYEQKKDRLERIKKKGGKLSVRYKL